MDQIKIVLPCNALTLPEPEADATQTPYEPELGQALFGNACGEFSLGRDERYAAKKLYELSAMLGKKKPEAQAHGLLGGEWGYGQDFKNEVFEMHPYWGGECTCGFDEKNSAWWKERAHAETCFCNRFHAEDERLKAEGIPFHEQYARMTKWAKTNGYTDAPTGMAAHCDCGVDRAHMAWLSNNDHAHDCREVLPNFRSGDLEIRWYKYISRGMSANRKISRDELREIFRKCRESIS